MTIPAGTLVPRDARDFGDYELLAKLATGGMAEIFLARPRAAGAAPGAVIVLKRILPHLAEDDHFVTMFRDEADLAAQLVHPNVCRVHALGEHAGTWFIAMEYLHGVALSRMMSRLSKAAKLLDVRVVAAIIVQACEGLHHAHEARGPDGQSLNVVHRDVSPPNIMVCADGVVKVLDFGIAKARGANSKTRTGTVKGKNAYMSPEQILGRPLDRRSDLFALGTVMYEMLAIKRLFHRESDFVTFKAITEEPIPDIRERRPDLPNPLRAALVQALARDPKARFATARELADAIRAGVAPLGGLASAEELRQALALDFADELAMRDEILRTADDPRAVPATSPRRPAPVTRPPPIPQAAARGELAARARPPSSAPPPVQPVPSMIVRGTPLAVPVTAFGGPATTPAPAPAPPAAPAAPAAPPAPPVAIGPPPRVTTMTSIEPILSPDPWMAGDPAADLLRTYRRRSLVRAAVVLGAIALGVIGLIVLVGSADEGARRARPPATSGAAVPADAAPADAAPPEPEPEPDAGPSERDTIEALSRYGFFSLAATAKTTIYIGGQRYGETPITRLPLPPGVYKVRAVGPRGKAKNLTVTIYGGKDTDEGIITW